LPGESEELEGGGVRRESMEPRRMAVSCAQFTRSFRVEINAKLI